jgi:hypothetical protein
VSSAVRFLSAVCPRRDTKWRERPRVDARQKSNDNATFSVLAPDCRTSDVPLQGRGRRFEPVNAHEEPSVILVFSSFAFAVAVAAVGPVWRRGTQARSSPGLPRFRLCGGHRQLVNSRSGYGWSHGTSAKDCILVRRRELRRTMSKQTFVAMRFSHERNNEPPSNLSRLRRACRNVSPGRRARVRRRRRSSGSSGHVVRAIGARSRLQSPTPRRRPRRSPTCRFSMRRHVIEQSSTHGRQWRVIHSACLV